MKKEGETQRNNERNKDTTRKEINVKERNEHMNSKKCVGALEQRQQSSIIAEQGALQHNGMEQKVRKRSGRLSPEKRRPNKALAAGTL